MTDGVTAADTSEEPEATMALDIYQAHLDASTRLVFEGAAEAYCEHAQLPFVFRTGEGVEVIETATDLAADIRQIHHWLLSRGVTDYHRIARSARFLDDDTIEGFHITYALQGAIQVVEPYASRMLLRRVDGGTWKTTYAEHELRDALYPGHDARAQHGLFSQTWTHSPSAVTRDQGQALTLYAAQIDAIVEAVNARDFERLLAMYDLPYHVHDTTGDTVVETVDVVRRHYDLFLKIMAEAGADSIRSTTTSAVFVTDDRLLGYHETSLMRGDEARFGPIRARFILIDKDGDWRVKSVANAITTAAVESGRLSLSPAIPTLREIEKRTKT
jgi:hypothetical protein